MMMPPINETHRSLAAFSRCSVTPGRQPLVGHSYDAGQENVGFVHQRLAAIGPKNRKRLRIPLLLFKTDGAVHLVDLLGDNRGEPPEHGFALLVWPQQGLKAIELALHRSFGAIVGCKIDFVAADKEPALCGFGTLDRTSQLYG